MVKISKYLKPALITFLTSKTRDEALKTMIETVDKNGQVPDTQSFYKALIEREKIVSTGIGVGTAIPHAKLPEYDDFFIVVGVLQQGVDWNSLDGAPVRLIFMIGGPDDKQTEYLQVLSGLTMAIKDEARRKKILSATTPDTIIELLKAF